jgi:hypothetical protein
MSISSHDGGRLPEAKGADRRVHQRRPIRPRLYVLLGGSGTDGILNDASEGGIALDMVGSEPPGEFVDVHFEMLELGRHFEAKGRVTWRDESTKKVGVTFVDLPEAARHQIREWLAMKAAAAAAARPAAISDEDRAGVLNPAPAATAKEEIPAEPPIQTAPAEPIVEPPSEAHSDAASQTDTETPGKEKGDQLIQNLIDSFNTTPKKPDNKYADAIAAWKLHSSGWNVDNGFFSIRGYWRWVAVGAVAGLAVLLAIGVTAHRLPWSNATPISVSKAGQSPTSAVNPQNQTRGNIHNDASDTANNVNGALNSVTTPPTLPPALASSLPKPDQTPCINLGPNSGKIRIYLWSEKDTPQAIVGTYAKNLRAVQDVQLVDKAPYDLVLYVNGAQVNASGSEAGFMWSSRVFRPWYCGQSLGLLEQTQVNESLHYVQGANLEQRIQAEVAFLILHTFESIRSEHQK